jgi:hypothetical protein
LDTQKGQNEKGYTKSTSFPNNPGWIDAPNLVWKDAKKAMAQNDLEGNWGEVE